MGCTPSKVFGTPAILRYGIETFLANMRGLRWEERRVGLKLTRESIHRGAAARVATAISVMAGYFALVL